MKIIPQTKSGSVAFRLLFLICLLTAVTSCKTKKDIAGVAMREREKSELLSVIVDNTIRYKTLSCNLKASVKPGLNEKSISSPANLKLVKDEMLQLSFQFLGFEVFRMIVSTDSLILIDRMNKQYVAESLSNVREAASFDFDFHNLQALFTNQLFLAGKPVITKNDYNLFSINQSQYEAFITSKDKNGVDYTFTADHTERIRTAQMANSSRTTSMLWSYNDFAATPDNQQFPMEMKMTLNLPKDEFSMDFSFSKIEVDKNIKIDFSIPSKYTRISLARAILIFKNLAS